MTKSNRTAAYAALLSGLLVLIVVGGVAYAGKRSGATGSDAPAAFTATNNGAITLPNDSGTRTKVVSLKLPAGTFVISGQAPVFGAASTGGLVLRVACIPRLSGGASMPGAGATASSAYDGSMASATVPVNFTVVNQSARTLNLSCNASWSGPGGGGSIRVAGGSARLTAVSVGSIN